MPAFLSHIKRKLRLIISKKKTWKEIEYFDDSWQKRVQQMAAHLYPGESVMDLGCGKMYLKNYLHNNTYIAVDYTKRDEHTVVCDFNKHEFPALNADVCFISGCLEYIKDYDWFVGEACRHCNRVILSYCTTDNFSDQLMRIENNWQNNLSCQKIEELFLKHSFQLKGTELSHNRDQIFIFEK